MANTLGQSGIGHSRTTRKEGFDWDTFWQFTTRHKAFNRMLYAMHFRHYVRLLDGVLPREPRMLELGAGSGIIPRRIVQRWGGRATLVDSNRVARDLFVAGRVPGEPLDYVLGDVLSLQFPPVFDLVYSDGLIEHFPEKAKLMAAHTRALKPSGHLVLFVPNNSFFFRNMTRFGPDMGYEERYSLRALVNLCENHGLRVLRKTEYPFEVGVLCQRQ
jgi:SAM-dependent methyltransferase